MTISFKKSDYLTYNSSCITLKIILLSDQRLIPRPFNIDPKIAHNPRNIVIWYPCRETSGLRLCDRISDKVSKQQWKFSYN